jgi:F-box/leucine-rich repeat protein 10/11
VNSELQELHGLKAIVMFLHSLPTNKKNVPELIRDPIALIKDVRTLVEQHRYDSPEAAVTGKPILRGPDQSDRVILVSIQVFLFPDLLLHCDSTQNYL